MPVYAKNPGHQYSRIATADLAYNTLPASGVFAKVFDLPSGAVPINGGLHVVTAFNPGTSLTASFGTAGVPAKYLAATSVAAAARTAAISQNVALAATDAVGITTALVGAAPTAGRAIFWIEYISPASAHESVG